MADQFYADSTVVTAGPKFSTDFRFLRQAISTPLVTYLQAGPTFLSVYRSNNPNNPKQFAYKCGPYEFRTVTSATTPPYPTNAVTQVAL